VQPFGGPQHLDLGDAQAREANVADNAAPKTEDLMKYQQILGKALTVVAR
jgi:hypothetical protein